MSEALELKNTKFRWQLGSHLERIDKSIPIGDRPCVFLTGGTGFIGSHVARLLVFLGYRVKAGVRKQGTKWTQWLLDLNPKYDGELTLVECSLDKKELWPNAVKGASIIIHCATRTRSSVMNKVEETHKIFESSTTGLVDMLDACKADGGIKRFIYCGSVVATNEEGLGEQHAQSDVRLFKVIEDRWTPVELSLANGSHPYSLSKTTSEMAFWQWMRRNPGAIEPVSILPCLTIGPIINGRYCSSLDSVVFGLIKDMPSPDIEYLWVDARDAADALVAAIQKPADVVVGERYIVANSVMPIVGINRFAHDWMHTHGHTEYGMTWGLSRMPSAILDILPAPEDFKKFLKPMVGVSKFVDRRKSIRDLGIIYTPIDESIGDALGSLFKYGLMPAPDKPPISPGVAKGIMYAGMAGIAYKVIKSKL